jgi:hypothetical protein
LPSVDEIDDFGEAFDRFGDAKVVLLGEATHGTSEFYRARAAITRRLIERHGFNIVAVEADRFSHGSSGTAGRARSAAVLPKEATYPNGRILLRHARKISMQLAIQPLKMRLAVGRRDWAPACALRLHG